MRDIKFRGKDLSSKWRYGDLVQEKWGQGKAIMIKKDKRAWSALEATIGQYTGLKDKNGKEIYEDDIIYCEKYIGGNWIEYCIEKGYVNFNNGEFGLYRKQGYYQSLYKFKEYDYEFEVIGNMHDNPELLAEKE